MRHSALAWLVVVLAGCPSKPGTTSPEPGSQPFVEQGGAALPIVLVPQFPATKPELWSFEPGGRRIASTEYGDCSIWDVETGRLIHAFEIGTENDESLPCFTWPAGKGAFELARLTSADERLELDGAEVIGPEGQTLRTLACPHCPDALAHSWAPKGHQVALLFVSPPHMEVWDADTGRMVVSEPLAAASELLDATIAWTVDRPFAVWSELGLTECDEVQYTCEFDEDGNPIPREVTEQRLQALGRTPIELGREEWLELLVFDPEARFVAWTFSWDERRAGTTHYLEVDALDGSPTGLAYEDYLPYDDYEGSTSRHGEWRSDGAVHYGVVIEDLDFEGSPQGLAWEELVVSPPSGRSTGTIAEGVAWGSVVEVVPYGLVDASPRVRGVVCHDDGGGETCSSLGVEALPDCELLDVGSGHGAELHDCGGRMVLRSGGKQHALPLDAAATFWWWMRGGALVLDDGDRLLVVDAGSGAIGLQRDGVAAGLDAKLGPELDRFVIVGEHGFELLDTRTLQVGTSVADEPIIDAALSPAGDRLALLGSEGEIIVHALPGGELLGRFASPGGSQIAYRQDGAALWVGDDRQPLALIDAASGQEREPQLIETIATALSEGGEIDPTWRFVVNDEFGSLMRTLDGRQLEWIGEARSTAIVPDTGQYQGPAPGAEYAFRVGSDPMAVPTFDAAALADQLAMPDLVERFLLGEPIPAPTIDPSELAALQAAAPRRQEP